MALTTFYNQKTIFYLHRTSLGKVLNIYNGESYLGTSGNFYWRYISIIITLSVIITFLSFKKVIFNEIGETVPNKEIVTQFIIKFFYTV